jgi:hypothetical protein
VAIRDVTVVNPEGPLPTTQQPLDLSMAIESERQMRGRVVIGITEGTADPVFAFRHDLLIENGRTEVRLSLPRLPLPRGRYFIWADIREDHLRSMSQPLMRWQPIGKFDVSGPDLDGMPRAVVRRAPFHVEGSWDVARSSGSTNGGTPRPSTPADAAHE